MNTTYTPGDRVTTPDGPGVVTEEPFLMSSGWTVPVKHDAPVSASGEIRYGIDEVSAEPAEEHTYTDEADHTLKVTALPGPRLVTKTLLPTEDEQGVIEHVASVTAPKGADAVALAKAVLEAAGDTGCEVISTEELAQLRRESIAADQMRDRIADLLETHGMTDALAEEIDRLPLLPDEETTEVRHTTDPEAYIDAVADALTADNFDITSQWAYTDGTYGTDENPEAWEGGIRIGDLTLAWNERDGWTLVDGSNAHDLADVGAPVDKVVAAAKKYLPDLVTKKARELAVGDVIHDGEALVVTAPPVDLLDGSVVVPVRDSHDEDDRVTLAPDAAVKVSA